jgi:hypothetical protein
VHDIWEIHDLSVIQAVSTSRNEKVEGEGWRGDPLCGRTPEGEVAAGDETPPIANLLVKERKLSHAGQ